MKLFGAAVGVIAGILLLMAPAAASAGSITLNGNGAFTVQWLETSTTPDVSGTANFVVTDFTASGFDLAITQVSNTTATNPDIDARLMSFGFGLSPDATSFTNKVNGAIFKLGLQQLPGLRQRSTSAAFRATTAQAAVTRASTRVRARRSATSCRFTSTATSRTA